MCGIAGILNFNDVTPSDRVIRGMNELQRHRGPDGEGLFIRDCVALGHRRLSIIDLDGGSQPLSNETGDVWLTYNGELYNHKTLRQDLQAAGHVFASRSDSEVIVHAYEEWGDACVHHFRGMFAFGIADFRRRRLFLARDHFGIKPLFYRIEDDAITFASELAPLVVESTPELDCQSLDYYLRYRYIPSPRTVYQRVMQVPPGHTWSCEFDGRQASLSQYWQFEFQDDDQAQSACLDSEGQTDAFQTALAESVDAHLESDVPVGAFLSGGVDSTLIVAQMARRADNVNAFSVGFSDDDYSELKHAQRAASTLGVQLHTEIVQPDIVEIFQQLFASYGQPFADTSAVPTWCVARLARQHVATVLSGDGADEAFAGYGRYLNWMRDTPSRDFRRTLKHPRQAWRSLQHYLRGTQPSRLQRWQSNFVGVVDTESRRALWQDDYRSFVGIPASAFTNAHRRARDLGSLEYAQFIDLHTYLPGDILTKVDVATMCHGLEARTPFTDRRMMEFAARLPRQQRFCTTGQRENVLKVLPKRLLARTFPGDFVHRRKQGFAIPESAWLQRGTAVRSCFDDLVANPRAGVRQYFCAQEIDRMVRDFDQHGRQPTALWLLMILGLWLEHHVGAGRVPLAALSGPAIACS